MDAIVSAGKAIAAAGRVVGLTMFNKGFVEIVHNWLCNTEHMGIHPQILLVVTDQDAYDAMKKLNTKATVVKIDLASGLEGKLEYNKVGYYRFMLRRTEVILELLKQQVSVFLFEADSVWFGNVFTDEVFVDKSYDLIGSVSHVLLSYWL